MRSPIRLFSTSSTSDMESQNSRFLFAKLERTSKNGNTIFSLSPRPLSLFGIAGLIIRFSPGPAFREKWRMDVDDPGKSHNLVSPCTGGRYRMLVPIHWYGPPLPLWLTSFRLVTLVFEGTAQDREPQAIHWLNVITTWIYIAHLWSTHLRV